MANKTKTKTKYLLWRPLIGNKPKDKEEDLSSIHEKAMYRYVWDGKSALAWELLFPGHLSFT